MIDKYTRKLIQAAQVFVPKRTGGLHLPAYHLVDASTSHPIDIPLSTFRLQMKELRSSFATCSMEEALASLKNGVSHETTTVVVTFDDAYENFYTHAWPVLLENKIPAMLYVPVDFVNGTGAPPISGTGSLRPCSWTQLVEMTRLGFLEIGSHSCSHSDLRKLDSAALLHEIADSRKKLEDKLGVAVKSFCYPKGLWSRRVEDSVREHYENAVIGGGVKTHSGKWDPYRLRRIPIRRDSPEELRPMLESSIWLEERLASMIRHLTAKTPRQ